MYEKRLSKMILSITQAGLLEKQIDRMNRSQQLFNDSCIEELHLD